MLSAQTPTPPWPYKPSKHLKSLNIFALFVTEYSVVPSEYSVRVQKQKKSFYRIVTNIFIVFNACDWLREHISFTRLISANHKQESKTIYGHHDWLRDKLVLWSTILQSLTSANNSFSGTQWCLYM